MVGRSVWKKGGSKVAKRREQKPLPKFNSEITLERLIPGGVIILEEDSPGELMNARRQVLWYSKNGKLEDGDITSGITTNIGTPIDVQEQVRSACLAFLASRKP